MCFLQAPKMRVTEMDKGEFMVLAFAEWGRKAAQGDIEITCRPPPQDMLTELSQIQYGIIEQEREGGTHLSRTL